MKGLISHVSAHWIFDYFIVIIASYFCYTNVITQWTWILAVMSVFFAVSIGKLSSIKLSKDGVSMEGKDGSAVKQDH